MCPRCGKNPSSNSKGYEEKDCKEKDCKEKDCKEKDYKEKELRVIRFFNRWCV